MRGAGQGAMLLFVTVVLGCGASDTTSPRPTIEAPSFSKDAGHTTAVTEQSVTGHALITLPAFDNAREWYSLSAIRHRDGSFSGEFDETSLQDGRAHIHARVYCFTIVGNTARLAARIERSNVSYGPPGSFVVWSVIDNGRNPHRAPDETTDIFFNGTEAQAQHHCDVGFPLTPYFPLRRGSLRIDAK